MLLIIDNGSIYTQNLIDFLHEENFSFEIKTPHEINLDLLEKFDSFILSGRRKNEKKINEINSKIIIHSIKNNKKLLGICYGAEILSLTLGGTIRKLEFSQKGDELIRITKKNSLVSKEIKVFESHGFEISKLPNQLISLAESNNCKNEIIQYDGKLIFGTQFHPEMSSEGKDIIQKFCSL
ncbi:MAG: type 1 glutamine amidotransferase [Nitrosopumilaceae archaeon]